MNILDWILVVLVCAYALSGYWQGFITGAAATVGLLLGGAVGIWVAPSLFGEASPAIWVSLGALFLVILAATVGQALFQYVGAQLRARISWQPARALDAIGGAALSAVAVLLVAWVLGVAVSGSRFGDVTTQVRTSKVLSAVDRVLPADSVAQLARFNNIVGATFFPRYLEPFAPERIVEVRRPPAGMTDDPQVAAAEPAVLKIHGTNECGRGVEGSGFFYANDRLMTNAHVVAGVDEPQIIFGDDVVEGRVVHYDPALDLAVIAVDDQGREPLRFDLSARQGQAVAVLGYPQDGPYDVRPGRIRDEHRLRSPDIYGRGSVLRDAYSLRSLIRPGNSGGPVVDSSGEVVGIVFAASVTDDETGYAITAEQAKQAAGQGLVGEDPVETGDCVG